MPTRQHRPTIRLLIAEGARNLRSSQMRTFLLGAALTLLLAMSLWHEGATLSRLLTTEAERWHAGGHVLIATADSGLDAESCSRLSRSNAVLASGGVRRTSGVALPALGADTRLKHVEATHEVFRIDALLDAGAGAPGSVLLDERSAAGIGRSPGDVLRPAPRLLRPDGDVLGLLPEQPTTVSTVGELDYVGPTLRGGLVTVIPARMSTVEQCVVLAEPGLRDEATQAASALRPNLMSDLSLQVERLSNSEPTTEELGAQHSSRLSRWTVWCLAAMGSMAWVLQVSARRSDAGLYLLSGFRRSEVAVILIAELALLLAGAFAASLLVVCVLILAGVGNVGVLGALALVDGATFVTVCLLLGTVGTAPLLGESSVLAMVKD